MRLDRAWIAARIAHAGGMCLLDEVLDWDAARIRCRSGTHRRTDNPLRAAGSLGAACAVEYAAQAIAVHGALLGAAAVRVSTCVVDAGPPPRAGFLACVRDLKMRITRLDDIDADLIVEATRIAGDAGSALYAFTVDRDGAAASPGLVSGRAAILVDRSRAGAAP